MMNGGVFPSAHRPLFIQKILQWPIIGTILSGCSNYVMFRENLGATFGPESDATPAEYHDFWAIVRHKEGYKIFGSLLRYISERKKFETRWVHALARSSATIPFLFIYGPHDLVNPRDEFISAYHKNVADPSSLVILGETLGSGKIGHYPHYEASQDTFTAYHRFLVNKLNFKS